LKTGVMQPYFFPYIGYWQLINAVDAFLIYDDVNFIKNGWINRNNILLGGAKHLITLPLDSASPFDLIKNTKITDNLKVKEKLLKTITAAYVKAPYYKDIMPIIEKTVLHPDNNISNAITYSIMAVADYLDIKTEIILSSDLKKDDELRAQDKIINIVKALGGDTYINAIGGQDLYNKDDFKNNGIELYFLKTGPVQYEQFKNEFVPNLSIIDVLMFNPVEKIQKMLDDYTLI